jgi:hypothetical protein
MAMQSTHIKAPTMAARYLVSGRPALNGSLRQLQRRRHEIWEQRRQVPTVHAQQQRRTGQRRCTNGRLPASLSDGTGTGQAVHGVFEGQRAVGAGEQRLQPSQIVALVVRRQHRDPWRGFLATNAKVVENTMR